MFFTVSYESVEDGNPLNTKVYQITTSESISELHKYIKGKSIERGRNQLGDIYIKQDSSSLTISSEEFDACVKLSPEAYFDKDKVVYNYYAYLFFQITHGIFGKQQKADVMLVDTPHGRIFVPI